MEIRSKFTIAAETTGQPAVDNLARSVGKVEQGVSRLPGLARTAATAFAGFAVGGVTALAAATKGAVDYASAIVDAADQTGLGVEAFQALRFAAGQAGVSADEFTSAMLRFNTTIGAAANGSRAQIELFARMGVAIRDAEGNVRSSEAVLADFADALESIDNPAQRARAAAEAFGRAAGPKMAVLLGEGSSGLQTLQQRAEDAGAVLSEKTVRAAEEAGDKLQALSDVLKTHLAAALLELIPVLTSAGEKLVELAGSARNYFDQFDTESPRRINSEIIQLAEHIDRVDSLIANSSGTLEGRNRLLEAQVKNLQKMNELYGRLRASVGAGEPAPEGILPPPTPKPTGGGTRTRPPAAAAVDTDPSQFPGSDAIRERIATEAQEAERLRDVINDIEGELPALADEAGDSVAALWEANNEVAERSLQDLQDITSAAAQGIADTLEDGVFALFADGVDGMVDVFSRALQRMVLDLANSALQEELQRVFDDALKGAGEGASGGGFGGVFASILGAFAGGKSGTASVAKNASGGSFVVPGPNSGDRVIPIFRANGGEIVDISQPGKRRGGGGVQIFNNIDARGADPATEVRIRREIEASERRTIAQVANLARKGRL